MEEKFVSECAHNTAFLTALGIERSVIRHSSGKSEVAKLLRNLSGKFALVDADPQGNTVPYFRDNSFLPLYNQYNIKIEQDQSRSHHIFILCPRLEDWIIDTSHNSGFDLARYNLPTDPERFHEIINQRLPNLKRLLTDLLKNSGINGVKEFKKQLSHLSL